VAYIREHYGTFFSVGVAGYPEGHPNRITKVEEGEVADLTAAERGRMAVERGALLGLG
jgi:methylenetetrahydrofolate reductase (NADPH)